MLKLSVEGLVSNDFVPTKIWDIVHNHREIKEEQNQGNWSGKIG